MVKHIHGTILADKLYCFSPEQPFMERKLLSTSENGRKYTLALNPAQRCAAYQVDGHIITEGDRCDKLIVIEHDAVANKWTKIFVELKGKNVRHAIQQLRCSIKIVLFFHPTIKKRYARIIAQSIPSNTGNSIVERARNEFRSVLGIELKCWSSGKTDFLK